ncbi:MAG: hypothetical protein AAGA55_03050 [Planctomycetota bacterium]
MEAHETTNPRRRMTCVVWTQPGAGMPAKLMRVLRARGLEPVALDSGYVVLARLCLAERSEPGELAVGPRSLLIKADAPEPGRVLSAMERFAPSARVWIYEPGSNPPLRSHVLSPMVVDADKSGRTVPHQPHGPDEPVPSAGTTAPVSPPAERPCAVGPASVAELKLTAPERSESQRPPAGHGRDAGSESGRAQTVTSRDVLDDEELEMLLAGERGREESRR